MRNIQPLESLSSRIHTISKTEIMPCQIHRDLLYYIANPHNFSGVYNMRALQLLRNAVISRSKPVFVEMAAFVLTANQTIKPKKSMGDRLNSIAIIACASACIATMLLLFLLTAKVERLEEKVLKIQQSVGYYEDSSP